jgi:DNA-binding NtrC family response regulator
MIYKKLDALVEDMAEKGITLNDALAEFERRYITKILNLCDNKMCKAAQILGIHRNTLSYKIKNSRSKIPSNRKKKGLSKKR